jgi:hypothetical protein
MKLIEHDMVLPDDISESRRSNISQPIEVESNVQQNKSTVTKSMSSGISTRTSTSGVPATVKGNRVRNPGGVSTAAAAKAIPSEKV